MTSLSLLIACLVLFWFVASHPSLTQRGEAVDNPTAANFLRRVYHESVVLEDFVYIQGGEFSQLVNGIYDNEDGPSNTRQNNVTLSIDLRTPWTNASLIIQTVSKSLAPVLNYENFWKDPDGNSCYLWNGELSYDARTFEQSPDSLWRFSSDGAGGGAWSQIPINYTMLSSLSQRLLRPGGTGSGVAIGSTGYYVGGRVWEQSDVDASPTGYFQNTVTSFNSSSGAWNNELPTRIGSSGTIEGARAVTIPAIGLDERGLMVIIGGRDPGTNVSAPPANYFGLDNVTIYDPYIDVWFAQHATGEVIPAIREMFCAVATAGDNGTYEIFIYGGVNQLTWEVYSDIYVLTIPGFVWFKAPGLASPARFSHTCNLVQGPQLMSIGGYDNPGSSENTWADAVIPDPFMQGIGIFDMTDLVWKSLYDPNATFYKSPQVVKDWYSAGNQESVQWQSLELARMFVRDSSVSVSPTPGATVSSSVPTSTAQSGGSNKAEIIGSVVGSVGGIAGILLAVASLWFAWRQWKITKAAKEEESSMDTSHQQSDPGDGTPQSGTQALTSKPTEILPASSLASPEAVRILQT